MDHLKRPESDNKLSVATLEIIDHIAEAYECQDAKKAMGELAIKLYRKWERNA